MRAPHSLVLLGARPGRPRRRAAKKCDELAPPHSTLLSLMPQPGYQISADQYATSQRVRSFQADVPGIGRPRGTATCGSHPRSAPHL